MKHLIPIPLRDLHRRGSFILKRFLVRHPNARVSADARGTRNQTQVSQFTSFMEEKSVKTQMRVQRMAQVKEVSSRATAEVPLARLKGKKRKNQQHKHNQAILPA